MDNCNCRFWKAAVLTAIPSTLIFCFGHMLPITFYNDCYLFAFLSTQFYMIFLRFVSLAQSKKGPPQGKGELVAVAERESHTFHLRISDSSYLILFVDVAYVLKFYFLISSFTLHMLHFPQPPRVVS